VTGNNLNRADAAAECFNETFNCAQAVFSAFAPDLGLDREAAKAALKQRGMEASELDVIIVCTVTPDHLFPSTACLVQHQIGATNVWGFDLIAACCSFLYGLTTGASLVASGLHKRVMVIGADTMSRITDYTDRATCVLFGDGAGAVVLAPAKSGEGILSGHLGADGSGGKYLVMPGGGSRNPKPKTEQERCITMDGKEVFKFAVKAMENGLKQAAKKAKIELQDIDLVIPHQANIRIIDHVAKKIGIPKEKFFINLDKYGNTSAASIPIALEEAYAGGSIKKNDIIAIIGFGAGLTYGANIIKWEV